jgi:hypothetical protein
MKIKKNAKKEAKKKVRFEGDGIKNENDGEESDDLIEGSESDEEHNDEDDYEEYDDEENENEEEEKEFDNGIQNNKKSKKADSLLEEDANKIVKQAQKFKPAEGVKFT